MLMKPKFIEELGVLSDTSIEKRCIDPFQAQRKRNKDKRYTKKKKEVIPDFNPMIDPFVPFQVKLIDKQTKVGKKKIQERVISYGLSSHGYDLRLGNKFKIFTNARSTIIDPKNFDDKTFVDHQGEYCIIPPNGFVLASSLEKIHMPDDVIGIVLGKSTYARTGIVCICTPLEAGWKGYVTLEFANTTPLPAKLYANEGCCQVVFFRSNLPAKCTYAARAGKYMDQKAEPTIPKV